VPAADQIRLVISGISGVTETIKGMPHVGPNQSVGLSVSHLVAAIEPSVGFL
jgi:hypothetical protein